MKFFEQKLWLNSNFTDKNLEINHVFMTICVYFVYCAALHYSNLPYLNIEILSIERSLDGYSLIQRYTITIVRV